MFSLVWKLDQWAINTYPQLAIDHVLKKSTQYCNFTFAHIGLWQKNKRRKNQSFIPLILITQASTHLRGTLHSCWKPLQSLPLVLHLHSCWKPFPIPLQSLFSLSSICIHCSNRHPIPVALIESLCYTPAVLITKISYKQSSRLDWFTSAWNYCDPNYSNFLKHVWISNQGLIQQEVFVERPFPKSVSSHLISKHQLRHLSNLSMIQLLHVSTINIVLPTST